MKRTKKWLLSALVLSFTATTALAVTSCGKKGDDSSVDSGVSVESDSNQESTDSEFGHVHSYTATVTAPTCTAEGYTTYNCACGDSYVDADSKVAALGHDYSTKVTKYPTATEAGEKKTSCANCTDSKTETIAALTVSAPQMADILVGLIGAVDASIAVNENSNIITVSEFEVPNEDGAVMEKYAVSFELAQVSLDTTEGDLSAYVGMKINISDAYYGEDTAEISKATVVGEFNVYVNGDDISFEFVDFDGSEDKKEESLNKLAYTAFANMLGMTYDEAVTLAYVSGEMLQYLPNAMQLIAGEIPVVTESYIQSVATLFTLVGQDIIVETKDGTDSVYALDLSALGHFIEAIEGETVGSYVDKVYGEGSMEALENFAVGLPAMTIKEVATSAITLSESYGIEVDNVFYLVNLFAVQMGAEDFDVEALIETAYDKTLGELIIASSGKLESSDGEMEQEVVEETEEMTVEQMTAAIAQTFEMIVDMTADDLYTMITGDQESFIENVSATLEAMPDIFTAEMTFDENGKFIQAVLATPEDAIAIIVDGTTVAIAADVNGVLAALGVGENGFVFEAKVEETVIANIEFLLGDNGFGADFMVAGDDYLDFSVDIGEDRIDANLVIRAWEGRESNMDKGETLPEYNEPMDEPQYSDKDIAPLSEDEPEFRKVVEINATAVLEEGVIVSGNVTIGAWTHEWTKIFDDEDNYIGEEYVETWETVATINFTNSNGLINATMNIQDEARVELSNVLTDSSIVFTMKVYDLGTGEDGDETEQVGELTFGYDATVMQGKFFATVENLEDGERETLWDAYVIMDNNQIAYFYWGVMNSAGSYGHMENTYEEGGVRYEVWEDIETKEWVEYSYMGSSNSAGVSIRTTYTETVTRYTTYWDENTWTEVEVTDSRTENTTVDESFGYDISYSFVDGVLSFNFTPVGEGGYGSVYFMSEMNLVLSENGITFTVETEESGEVAAIELKKIENGFAFVMGSEVNGVDDMGLEISVTLVDGVLSINYDITKIWVGDGEWIMGEGGITATIS